MTENATRLFDFAYLLLKNNKQPKLFNTKLNNSWIATSVQEYLKLANTISRALLRLSIKPNDKIAVVTTTNRIEFLIEWCKRKNIETNEAYTSLISNKKVINRIQKEIDSANKNFGQWEQIKAFELTADIWSVENGLLTPTLKLKRSAIKIKYKQLFDKIYNN
ncbi:hypothetical protein SAMN06265371_10641 [Lutibacter agarilyticus]|uniref:AMP-binding enzyme n=1 Tax=Lutibacter agarilyticus TaxID=1109740 RepID=A0A238XJN6_9FLAO|nr:hypothetical protein [Lutibacter agarilyticus]SNR58169.1 hypothetical protein SAMN06265371_10641 [Lutibacter agarilyticus]